MIRDKTIGNNSTADLVRTGIIQKKLDIVN